MLARLRRAWRNHRPILEPPEVTAVRLRAIAARIEEALDHIPTTETRRPTMDLDALIARWRRLAGHVRINPGALTPADVYELCADELEARIRTHELQQREREAVGT